MGTLLPLPTATDPDFGVFSVTGYRLQADPDVAEKFELLVSKGSDRDETLSVQLVVRRALDRELIDRYSLRVYAADGDARGASNSGSVDVLINVLDVNDNRPVFEGKGRYEVTVPENVPLHTTILLLHTTMMFEGEGRYEVTVPENVPLHTTISPLHTTMMFEGRYEVTVPENVPLHTTILPLQTTMMFEGEGRYEVTVPENVPLHTTISPLQTTMMFEGEGRYEVTVPENVPLHTTILRVNAVDDDEGLNGQVR